MVTDLVSKYKAANFGDKLRSRAAEIQSWLCVGLDPDTAMLPSRVPRTAQGVVDFCRDIVIATSDCAVAFKLQFAFFEALGTDAFSALKFVRDQIPGDIPVIADAKRGDIDNSSKAYARAIFDVLAFDAVTVSPYLGWDALAPFLARPGVGVLVLCKTSNPGASRIQDLRVDGEPLYRRIARQALALDATAEVGLVVGATEPDALEQVRSLSDDVLILAPGVGAQGAEAAEAINIGANDRGDNLLVAASRSILFASTSEDFQSAARAAAETLARSTWLGDRHASPAR